jgi:hypothetical protein
MEPLFTSTETVKAELNQQKYIASDEIATIVGVTALKRGHRAHF